MFLSGLQNFILKWFRFEMLTLHFAKTSKIMNYFVVQYVIIFFH